MNVFDCTLLFIPLKFASECLSHFGKQNNEPKDIGQRTEHENGGCDAGSKVVS